MERADPRGVGGAVAVIYANEWEPYPAAWLRNLAAAGEIPPCEVDERSITDVRADELRGFRQWHMFAGIGGWPIALRLAGWPDDREIFTASCPCQPFSKAGRGAGFDDERDLWPCTHAIIRDLRPEVCMGEQVDGPAGNLWLDRTRTDMEDIGYAFGAVILPACGVNAPTRRYRWFWIASRTERGRKALEWCKGQIFNGSGATRRWRAEYPDGSGGCDGALANRVGAGLEERFEHQDGRGTVRDEGKAAGAYGAGSGAGRALAGSTGEPPREPGLARRGPSSAGDCGIAAGASSVGCRSGLTESMEERITEEWAAVGGHWDATRWVIGPDRDKRTGAIKARRIPAAPWWVALSGDGCVAPGVLAGSPELRPVLLAKGWPNRAAQIKGYGNAIVPQIAAVVIRAFMDAENSVDKP